MSHLVKILWLLTAFILLGLSACGGAAATPTPVNTEALYTQIAQTVMAQVAATASAVPPTATMTETPAASPTDRATNTPLLTATPAAGTPSATVASLPTQAATQPPPQQAGCDNFTFTDANYPDGTVVAVGEVIVKTWSFTNLGPCTWNANYRLIYGWGTPGTDWDQLAPVNFSGTVTAGQTANLSVRIRAPLKTGGYAAWFRLQNDKGYNFGPVFAVSILVK
jgi:hypothetical protein